MAVAGLLSITAIASSAPAAEDRYIATRDAAIEKFSPAYDAGKFDDTAKQAEEAASETVAKGNRALRLIDKRRIVDLQFAQRRF